MTNTKQCKLCNKNIGKKFKLNCGRCSGYFHLECGKVSEVDARLMQQEKTPWECDKCKNSRSSLLHRQSSPLKEDGINELKSIQRELQNELWDMRQSMDFLNDKYEEEKKKSKIMSDMFTEISKDNQLLKEKVMKLERVVNSRDSKNIKVNICITDNNEKKSASDKIVKLFQYLNVPVTVNDFKIVNYFENNSGIKLLVTLSSIELKNNILKARSRKKGN